MNKSSDSLQEFKVHRVLTKEWEKVRDIRIRSVTDSPQAFGDTKETVTARTQETWEQWIENSHQYVIEVDDKFIASVTFRKDPEGVWIINGVWTDPLYRNKGLSRKLFEHVFCDAKEMNIDSIKLKVNPTQTGAVYLYESLGFIKIGTSERLPFGDGSHEVLDLLEKKMIPDL